MNQEKDQIVSLELPSLIKKPKTTRFFSVKIFLLIIFTSFFSWAFVFSGMQFKSFSSEGLFSFVLLVPFLILDTLQHILSIIPRALVHSVESLSLPWPFIVSSIIIKYSLTIILASIPFFIVYFLVRKIHSIEQKKLEKSFVIACLIIIALFISFTIETDLSAIKEIKTINKICENNSICKNFVYKEILKNRTGQEGIYARENIRSGFDVPFLSSLREDIIKKIFISLPESSRKLYCDNLYNDDDASLYKCKKDLGLLSGDSFPAQQICLKEARSNSYLETFEGLTDSCAKNFIKINPINIAGLKVFLSQFNYIDEYSKYKTESYYTNQMEPKLRFFDNMFTLSSHIEDREPSPSGTYLYIIQANPSLFQKHLDGNWSPVEGQSKKKEGIKQFLFEQKISNTNKEHLKMFAYAASKKVYRIGFLAKDIFLIVEAQNKKGDADEIQIRKSAERLTKRILDYLYLYR